ncbi:MAG: flavodoxin [Cellvibrionaceae bacterium]|nr:flavodoxin [Cellvibrionaceae bacterium]MCV6624678.1 flavodoxin [Cellvibrionaceae bacterium]
MSNLAQARVGLIFGTDTGNTEDVGEKICDELATMGISVDMTNITDIDESYFERHDFIIMGIPTWDFGGIQEDWEDQYGMLNSLDLSGKTVALYGLGDQLGYGDYFLDAMGWLHEIMQKVNANMIGYWPTVGYDFEASLGCSPDKSHFFGLAIDEDQQFEQTDARVSHWVKQISEEYGADQAA